VRGVAGWVVSARSSSGWQPSRVAILRASPVAAEHCGHIILAEGYRPPSGLRKPELRTRVQVRGVLPAGRIPGQAGAGGGPGPAGGVEVAVEDADEVRSGKNGPELGGEQVTPCGGLGLAASAPIGISAE
jgi:hypothetical protein